MVKTDNFPNVFFCTRCRESSRAKPPSEDKYRGYDPEEAIASLRAAIGDDELDALLDSAAAALPDKLPSDRTSTLEDIDSFVEDERVR